MSSSADLKITVWGSHLVSEEILQQCAKLFSENYGVWGKLEVKPGEPIHLSAARLRSQCLFNEKTCSLVTASLSNDELIGHCFVCRFPFEDGMLFIFACGFTWFSLSANG